MNAETKPPPVKRPLKPEPEDDTATDAPPPKSGILPTGLSRAIVLGSVILGLVVLTPLLLGHRYELVAVARGDNAMMYRIDTLTGHVSMCTATSCMPVAEKENGG